MLIVVIINLITIIIIFINMFEVIFIFACIFNFLYNNVLFIFNFILLSPLS